MSRPTTNVCLIGHKFMGRTHSNAYLKVNKFFPELALVPKMHTIVGRNEAELKHFAEEWGWAKTSIDWKAAIQDPEVQLVDIGTPNNMRGITNTGERAEIVVDLVTTQMSDAMSTALLPIPTTNTRLSRNGSGT